MDNKKISFLLFLVLFSAATYGMDRKVNNYYQKNKASEATSFEFLHSFEHDFPYEIANPCKNKDHTRIAAELFVNNQSHVITAMNEAAKRTNTKVHLTVGTHSANDINLYKVTTLERRANAHGKITVSLLGSPGSTKYQKGDLYIGSGNASNKTWKNKSEDKIYSNFETGTKTNDPKLSEQAYTMILSQSPISNKRKTIKETPDHPSLYSSKQTNLNKSIAKRLFTLAKNTNKPREAYIRTMTLNDEKVVKAAIKAKKSGARVELIADKAALSKNGIPLLQKLDAADVPVHIFYPDNDSRTIQHGKSIDIVKDEKYMHLENTGNLTKECAQQTNYTLFLPNDKNITQQSISNFQKIKALCQPLKSALRLKEKKNQEKSEKKVEKRKATQEAKNAPAKKKKKTK